MINDVKLTMATAALTSAQAAQIRRLHELYPLGSKLAFRIMHGQKTPSTGQVVGHESSAFGGHVIVNHDQAKERSRYKRRTVYLNNIIDVEKVGTQ